MNAPKPNKANTKRIKYAMVFSTKRKKEIPWCGGAGLSPPDGCDVGTTVGAGVVPGTVGAAVVGACVTGAIVGADVLATVGATVVGATVVTLSVALVGAIVGANVVLLLFIAVGAAVVIFDAVGAVVVVLSFSSSRSRSSCTMACVLDTALKRRRMTQSHCRLRLHRLQHRSFISLFLFLVI